jgi:hypothetical protein
MKLTLAFLFSLQAFAQSADPWKPFEFLLGEWTGQGEGGPGQGTGGFSFQFDLQQKILVRKNFAESPAQNGRRAFRHDDLMIIYISEGSNHPQAIYFDSEGHSIRYTVDAVNDSLVFESESAQPGPHYRLTYTPVGERLKGRFEIRAPGESQYKAYIDFAAHRTK